MTQHEWSARLAGVIAEQVKRYRVARGMSAQQLADATAELGHHIQRSVLANLESGRRANVSVADLLVLAKCLGVPPVLLLGTPGADRQVEVLPGQPRAPHDVARWIAGQAAFPAAEERHPLLGPMCGTDRDNQAYGEMSVPAVLFAEHDQRGRELAWEHGRMVAILKATDATGDERERREHEGRLPDARRQVQRCGELLAKTRWEMRHAGLVPPSLPAALASVVPEQPFVIYERHEGGQVRARRSVDRNSDEDYHLNAQRPLWRPVNQAWWEKPPADYDLDDAPGA